MSFDLKKEVSAVLDALLKRPHGSLYRDTNNAPQAPDKTAALQKLRTAYTGCTKCPLASQGRKQVVFGVGTPDAKLFFVGEGPGRDEDAQGAPFVGRAGKLLTSIIEAMGLTRDQVFISNTVKCRPPNNRAPLPNESSTCIDLILLQELAIVKPTIVCTLGATATQALLGKDATLAKTRGKLIKADHFLVLPTYHPAYLLRNPPAKKFVWQDMQLIMEHLGLDAK